ncbi:hypothetical protein EG349_01380 [Chryseobacterium shandongense]|uniref:Uncharacterized protein n=1 Tax=Chryseobacterium shandongense TaxID=1493872 RepID=A0AAD1DKF3_9FLAO|nr:hypothetical protein [Chryseobacterium shandongense]AZA85536.1 hypothetical protein EG349_01380 [Chryseobacterium shandongense]AZA97708.1 hypothetical protein EG353_20195 [Chryseobacterium shandongense]
MNKFKIQIDNNSIAKYKDSITGTIYINFNDTFFPEKNWNDFVIILINNWIESSYNILSGITESEEFYFMDGPFSMIVQKLDTDICIVELVENHTNILMNFKISVKELFNEIFKKAISLENYCKKQGWETEDIKKLQYFKNKIITPDAIDP